jgi:hypothetical protein
VRHMERAMDRTGEIASAHLYHLLQEHSVASRDGSTCQRPEHRAVDQHRDHHRGNVLRANSGVDASFGRTTPGEWERWLICSIEEEPE